MSRASSSSTSPRTRSSVHDGGYESYLEEREIARRHAREAYEEYAGTKADLESRARTQREWSSKGVRNAMKKSPDNDKIRRAASIDSSEKQARKVRQMESRIARLDEVEEPRKEWVLQFSIGDAAAVELGRRDPQRGDGRRGDFTLGPVSLQVDARQPHRHHRTQRRRQDHPAGTVARPSRTR